jgi:ubiquinone/menaquinone biosynthesis C-methylase UbiE
MFTTPVIAENSSLLSSDNPFGKRADTIQIDANSIPEPPLSKTKKSFLTANKFGFDMFKSESTWVVEAFLNDIKPGMIVMDSGAGYGAMTREALNKNAVVISNDISDTHLIYNLKKLSTEQKTRLYLNDSDVRKLDFKENSLDRIVFHRVLHFFKAKEIEAILTKAHKWLKKDGKIYIVMISKDHILYRDKIQYDASKKWPGEDLVVVKEHLPTQAYSMQSNTLHVASIETLRERLAEAGFIIEKADYVALKTLGSEPNRDGKEAVGIIGVKK